MAVARVTSLCLLDKWKWKWPHVIGLLEVPGHRPPFPFRGHAPGRVPKGRALTCTADHEIAGCFLVIRRAVLAEYPSRNELVHYDV